MYSDSDPQVIVDSEPERLHQQQHDYPEPPSPPLHRARTSSERRRARSESDDDHDVNNNISREGNQGQQQRSSRSVVASTSSHYFATAAPPSPTKRRRLPASVSASTSISSRPLAPTTQPPPPSSSPPPLFRKISLSNAISPPLNPSPSPSPSPSTSILTFPPPPAQQPLLPSNLDNLATAATRRDKKAKKRHASGVGSQFKTASSLLKANPGMRDEPRFVEEEVVVEEESRKKGRKGKKKVKREDEESEESLPIPPRLDPQDFVRAEYGLPELGEKSTRPMERNRRKKKKEVDEEEKMMVDSSIEVIDLGDEEDTDEMATATGEADGDEEEEQEDDDDDDDEQHLTAVERLHLRVTKFKYNGGGGGNGNVSRTSSTSSLTLLATTTTTAPTKTNKTKRKPLRTSSPPPTITLPPDDLIRLTNLTCPLCSTPWPPTKSLSSKSTHLQNCSTTQLYTSETVQILLENRLLELAHQIELDRREKERGRSLFARAVGEGEGGSNAHREVRVVGVEGGSKDRENEWQKELDKGRKRNSGMVGGGEKVGLVGGQSGEKVVKLAREIKRRKIKEAREKAEKEEEGEGGGAMMRGGVGDPTAPHATGLLRPESASMRSALVLRAEGIIEGLGGTGLTQLPTPAQPPRASYDLGSDDEKKNNKGKMKEVLVLSDSDDSDDDERMEPPPPTQGFEPSKLAKKFEKEGKMIVRSMSNQKKEKTKKITSMEMEEQENEEREGGGSMWLAAGMKDDAYIDSVVSSPFSTPPRSFLIPVVRDDNINSNSNSPATSVPMDFSPIPTTSTSISTATKMKDSPASLLARSMTALGLGLGDVSSSCEREEVGGGGGGGWVSEGWSEGEGVLVWEGGEERMETEETAAGEGEKEEDDESDEEPLIITSARRRQQQQQTHTPTTPITPFRSQSKKSQPHRAPSLSPPTSISSPSSSASSSSPSPISPPCRPPGCPDYTLLTLPELNKQVAKYGFRSSKEKSVLVRQMTQVWCALHPEKEKEKVVKKKKGEKVVKEKKKTRKEKEREEVEEFGTVGERLMKLIVGEKKIYERVLRYEPIHFDEIVSLAQGNGLKAAKPVLMRCLDEQCITFFTQDPTNGQRSRYK